MNIKEEKIIIAIIALLILSPMFAFGASEQLRAMIRSDGTLLVNDKPIFPIGARTEKIDDIKEIAKCGFNLVLGSGEWTAKHYAEAKKYNLMIMGGHYAWAHFMGTRKKINLRARGEAVINNVLKYATDQRNRTLVQTLKQFDSFPRLIGWKIGDEPEAKLTEIVEAGYEIIKSYNPSHIVAPIICDRQWLCNFRNACDVIMIDNYPIRGSYHKKYLTSINETYKRIELAAKVMKDKAVWYISPLYPPSYWSMNPSEEMTLKDMRLVNYAGLIAGAKGIIMYHWGLLDKAWTKDEKGRKMIFVDRQIIMKRRQNIISMVAELRKLTPIICNGRVNSEPDIRWISPGQNGPGPQIMRVFDYYGKQYVMIINLLDVPLVGRVFGPDPAHNFRAYDADVFLGSDDLKVTSVSPGEPEITVAPRGAGVFVLTRRSIIEQHQK